MAVTQLFSSARPDRPAPAALREPSRVGSPRVERRPAFSLESAESKPVPKSAPSRPQATTLQDEASKTSAAGKTRQGPPSRPGTASTVPRDTPTPTEPPPDLALFASAPQPASPGAEEAVARSEEHETQEPAPDPTGAAEAPMAMPETATQPAPPAPLVSTGAAPTSRSGSDGDAETPPAGATGPSGVMPPNAATGPLAGARETAVVADPNQAAQAPVGQQDLDRAGSVDLPLAGVALPPAELAPGKEQTSATIEAVGAASGTAAKIGAEEGSTIGAAGARRRSTPALNTATPSTAQAPSPLLEPAQAVAAVGQAPAAEAELRAEAASEPTVAPSTGKEPLAATDLPTAFAAPAAPVPPAPAIPSPALTVGIEAGVSGAAPASVADAGFAVAASAQAGANAGPPVPLGAVPMTIAMRALQDAKRFEIRLDPVELGRIDVRLDIDRQDGSVRADLVVDRPATLALLQRDAGILQNALSQAGLDASAGITLSLRDGSAENQNPNPGQGHEPGGRGHPDRGASPPGRPTPTSIDGPAPIRLRPIGIDIRI